ncbi:MAG TPA: hypothetical protein VMU47_10980 [Caldimonas sp.]|nr:hypothetical protein [Caldimonas sp.]
MNFSAAHFERFCSLLKIDSKEKGSVPFKWTGAQRYLVNEIERALRDNVHTFMVLKARQLGISTLCLALDLYWMFMHKGLQGALVTDTDENRESFKATLTQYHDALPRQARVPQDAHNRVQMVLKNRSVLKYIVAGKKKNESLGAGKAVNFMHATECATWGDEQGLKSLIATLAQQNPARLYIFESTAYGYNMWYEMCEAAKSAESQRFIFIGWWRNEMYAWPKESREYKTYWDGSPTSDELVWMREVEEEYKAKITPEQLAWWRWCLEENCAGDLNTMYQMYPPTANYAFQMSGSKFFSAERLNISFKRAMKTEAKYYRYEFGLHFEQTKFVECAPANAECWLWDEPIEDAQYVMGADPAYGSSEWADRFAISLWRCFADRMVQVGEVCTADWTPAKFAWVMCHLAGSYRPCMVNLELQGPGEVVFNEYQNLQRFTTAPNDPRRDLYAVTNSIRDFIHRKPDSFSGGMAPMSRSTLNTKITQMETLRSYFERDMLEIRSPLCLEEMRHISRDGDKIGGEGRAKDDLAIAISLAVLAWDRWIKQEMSATNRYYAIEMAPKGTPRVVQPLERNIAKYFYRNRIRGFGAPT